MVAASTAVGTIPWSLTIGHGAFVKAASNSQEPAVGLDSAGQMMLVLLIAFLVGLVLAVSVVDLFKKSQLLKLAVRISACVAILLMTILVIAGIIVDRTINHQMGPEYAFVSSLITIVSGISGVIIASLYKSRWVEGPVR